MNPEAGAPRAAPKLTQYRAKNIEQQAGNNVKPMDSQGWLGCIGH
jgi:hypothetical protein